MSEICYTISQRNDNTHFRQSKRNGVLRFIWKFTAENEVTRSIVSEIKELIQDKEVQKMLLAEKYAVADFNSTMHEREKKAKDEGQTLLVSAIQRLRAGETREALLSEGYDKKTIELAYACR